MESLVLQKEKGVCSDSPSIWFHSVAGVLFRTWRQVQVAQRHADIGSVTAAGSYFAYLPLVIMTEKYLNIFNYVSDRNMNNYKIWGEMFF